MRMPMIAHDAAQRIGHAQDHAHEADERAAALLGGGRPLGAVDGQVEHQAYRGRLTLQKAVAARHHGLADVARPLGRLRGRSRPHVEAMHRFVRLVRLEVVDHPVFVARARRGHGEAGIAFGAHGPIRQHGGLEGFTLRFRHAADVFHRLHARQALGELQVEHEVVELVPPERVIVRRECLHPVQRVHVALDAPFDQVGGRDGLVRELGQLGAAHLPAGDPPAEDGRRQPAGEGSKSRGGRPLGAHSWRDATGIPPL
jgi:hypothetical protein